MQLDVVMEWWPDGVMGLLALWNKEDTAFSQMKGLYSSVKVQSEPTRVFVKSCVVEKN